MTKLQAGGRSGDAPRFRFLPTLFPSSLELRECLMRKANRVTARGFPSGFARCRSILPIPATSNLQIVQRGPRCFIAKHPLLACRTLYCHYTELHQSRTRATNPSSRPRSRGNGSREEASDFLEDEGATLSPPSHHPISSHLRQVALTLFPLSHRLCDTAGAQPLHHLTPTAARHLLKPPRRTHLSHSQHSRESDEMREEPSVRHGYAAIVAAALLHAACMRVSLQVHGCIA